MRIYEKKERPLSADAALDRCFLETRCKLIEIAANLDRIHEGDGADRVKNDKRLKQIDHALNLLQSAAADKASACQMIFSLDYEVDWKQPNPKR